MPKGYTGFSLTIEYYREEDGRWLADIAALPGGGGCLWTEPTASHGGRSGVGVAIDCRPAGAWRSCSRTDERLLHCRLTSHHEIGLRPSRGRRWLPCSTSIGLSNDRAVRPTAY